MLQAPGASSIHHEPNEIAHSNSKKGPPDFEQTYPRYEFSELVRIGLIVADWLGHALRERGTARPDAATPISKP